MCANVGCAVWGGVWHSGGGKVNTPVAMTKFSASTRRSVLICVFYASTSVTLSFVNKVRGYGRVCG